MKVSVFTKREIHMVIFFLITQILNEYDPKIADFKATYRTPINLSFYLLEVSNRTQFYAFWQTYI